MSVSISFLKSVADNVFRCTREKVNVRMAANKVIVQATEPVINELESKMDNEYKGYVEFVTEIDI